MKSSKQQIGEALTLLFGMYDMSPKKEVFETYINLLNEHPVEDVKLSIRDFVKTSKFKPTVAAILEPLQESVSDIEARAITQVARVERSVRLGNKVCLSSDRITAYLITSRWDLRRLEDMSEQDFKFFRKDFINAYISFSKSPRAKKMAESTGALGFNDEIESISSNFKPNEINPQLLEKK